VGTNDSSFYVKRPSVTKKKCFATLTLDNRRIEPTSGSEQEMATPEMADSSGESFERCGTKVSAQADSKSDHETESRNSTTEVR
jgi:hypothetical protein